MPHALLWLGELARGGSMDVLEFIQKSEWPLVALIAITVLHKPIARLIDRVRPTKLSAWGISVELDKVEILTEETRAMAKAEAPKRLEKTEGDLLTFQSDEYNHPQLVIIKSWIALERALLEIGPQVLGSATQKGLTPMNIATLTGALRLTSNEIEAIFELRKVRNRVAHEIDFPVTRADAIRFAELSRDLVARVEMAAKEIKRPTT